ncbi:MGMT family protein [Candidatus Saccharibacteria bacterium]|nr:MGMT family protein [Candidatus Saccharibacteria bacterium]MCL1963099.1 MGMT family protein [Candidatus Saccharibacteria bacterium]
MKPEVDNNFCARVCDLVSQIPYARVMTYGDIAALCGSAFAARIVGGIAHFGDPDLPWHRVVNRSGGLASGYYGGKRGHQMALESENVPIKDFKIVDFAERRWLP